MDINKIGNRLLNQKSKSKMLLKMWRKNKSLIGNHQEFCYNTIMREKELL